jgi:ketosteroid isomerase-like protein
MTRIAACLTCWLLRNLTVMHRTSRSLLAPLVAATFVPACDSAPSVVRGVGDTSAANADSTSAAIRIAIGGAWADHLAAAKRGDTAGVIAMYANDAVYAVRGAPEVRGRPAIDSLEARGLRAATVLDPISHTTHAVHPAGDIAYELGTISGPVRPTGDTVRVVTFRFMAQWRRESDGAWRLTYLVGQ